MTAVYPHKVITFVLIWSVFLLLLFRMWRRGSKRKYRELSPLYLVLINILFCVSAWHYAQLHQANFRLMAMIWAVAAVVFAIPVFIHGMRAAIAKDHKSGLVKIPIFYYQLIYFVYIPYLLVYFSVVSLAPQLITGNMYVAMFVMAFKGCISGIYLGFSAAALLQIYDD